MGAARQEKEVEGELWTGKMPKNMRTGMSKRVAGMKSLEGAERIFEVV